LQRVVRREGAGGEQILGTEGGSRPRIRNAGRCSGTVRGSAERARATALGRRVVLTIVHRWNHRVEIVERQQVNAARALITDREQIVPGQFMLDAESVF